MVKETDLKQEACSHVPALGTNNVVYFNMYPSDMYHIARCKKRSLSLHHSF